MIVVLAGGGYQLVAERRFTWIRMSDGAVAHDVDPEGRIMWLGGSGQTLELSEPDEAMYDLLDRLARHPDWDVGSEFE